MTTKTPLAKPTPKFTTASDFMIGDVVWARPWKDGRQLPIRRGLVMVAEDPERPLVVWFYGMGDPEAGASCQLIYPREVTERWQLGYIEASLRQLRKWERQIKAYDHPYGHALGWTVHGLRVKLERVEREERETRLGIR